MHRGLYEVCIRSVRRLYLMKPEITNRPCPCSGAVAKRYISGKKNENTKASLFAAATNDGYARKDLLGMWEPFFCQATQHDLLL